MKNSLVNFPGLKNIINYWHAIKHKQRSKQLLIGSNNELRNVTFGRNVALGNRVSILHSKIDSFSYVSEGTFIRNTTFGKFCSVGACCQIGLGIHPLNEFISSHPLFYSNRPQIGFSFLKETKFTEFAEVQIGNDVWIGAGAIILDGVTIGDCAVIAAGSVVTENVDSFSVVAGAPAKHKKYKFHPEKIEEILRDPWWEKDIEWIRDNLILPDSNSASD